MRNTIESQFKVLIDIYIKKIDYLNIGKIFAKYEAYTLVSIREVFRNQNNYPYIRIAINEFISYLEIEELEIDKIKIYFSKKEISMFVLDEPLKDSKTRYYYLTKLAFVIAFYKHLYRRFDEKKVYIETISNLNFLENYRYFRGHTNCDWRISPSILRGLNQNILLDDNYYFALLTKSNLEQKYNQTMGKGKFSIENKFNKYSFIQHACSYSPFVDFTKSPIIAASFALSNASKLNDFINHDACIICMKFGNEDKTKLITDKSEARLFIKNEMRLDIIDSDTFIFGKNYEIAKSDGSIKKICYYTFDELLSRLSPDYKILDIQTNDRMTYQKGLFICFYGCLCLREFVAYELCPDLYLTKIFIKTGNKRSILEDIYKHYRQYDPEHLLDPYLYFNE